MLSDSKAFSGIGVDDLEAARRFYGETLGQRLEVLDEGNGLMTMHLAGDRPTLIYQSPGMTPPSYTVLNFPVDDVDAAVDWLTARGVDLRALRGHAPGAERRDEGRRPRHRLVQGPGGQHPVGAEGGIAGKRGEDASARGEIVGLSPWAAVPTISRFYGIDIEMYFNDHGFPHFHARHANGLGKVRIDNLEVINSDLAGRHLRLVLAWAGFIKELEENWRAA